MPNVHTIISFVLYSILSLNPEKKHPVYSGCLFCYTRGNKDATYPLCAPTVFNNLMKVTNQDKQPLCVQMIVVATVGIAVETSSPLLMTYTKIKYTIIIAIHHLDVKTILKDKYVI